MNKHTRKKYPHAVKVITVYEDEKPKGEPVSLFNETVKRATQAEARVAELEKRCDALEKALAASRKVNEQAIKAGFARSFGTGPAPDNMRRGRNINALSDEETEQLFAQLSVPDDYVSEQVIERPATPWRERVIGPICALFRGANHA